MSNSSNSLRLFAEQLAREVGRAVLDKTGGGRVDVSFKGKLDLVTEIDLWSEREIARRIAETYPSHLLVGEETSAKLSSERGQTLEQICSEGTVWVVDPIDGTTNFANGLPQYSISIGVYQGGKRAAGVVYDITRDELFSAALGGGAALNGRPIAVGSKTQLIDAVIATGLPYDRVEKWAIYSKLFTGLVHHTRAVRILGSAAIDLCWVACGRLDGFCEYSLKPWDVSAGTLIIEEAGGTVENFGSRGFTPFGPSFLATNSKLCAALQSAITGAG